MDLEKLMNAVLAHCPEAQLGEDEDGRVVIMTGVKADATRSTPTPDILRSRWYLQPCISLRDYCEERGLHLETVWETLRDSLISFGNNDDTLVRPTRLCEMLEIEPPEEDLYMISLGW